MRHIYRQVTGLQRYATFVMTRERPMRSGISLSRHRSSSPARGRISSSALISKYLRKLPPVYYRGELQVLIKLLKRRPADVMHAYFGHTGVHLLPFIQEWDKP
ncbi:MAG: hypothetical protein WDN28_00595 [Chthoniobacter sp.]